ncbi:hypothetical protein GCM10029978_116080 [Actinoallomurus acanthiterrae]
MDPDRTRRSRRGLLVFLPLVPTLALLSAVWLPFVNTPRLWLGMPRLFVWCSAWVLLITPALAVVEWGRPHAEDPEERS